MYNETTRLVKVIEVPLVADENEDVLVDDGTKSGATKEPVRGESDDQQTGVTYKLSDTAENLWIAYEVVAEYTDDTGKTHYAQLAKKEMASQNSRSDDAPKVFRFTFDSGDEFECENADDYPTLTNGGEGILAMTGTVPYGAGGGGTGGGVLVVTGTLSGSTVTLDKTWQEIHDAMLAGGAVMKLTQPDRIEAVTLASYNDLGGTYDVTGYTGNNTWYSTSTPSGYPSATVE